MENERQQLLEHLQRASEIVASWPDWKQRVLGDKPKRLDVTPILKDIDKRYFDDESYKQYSLRDAAYHLATWLFDKGYDGDDEALRRRLKKRCPPVLYLLTLEHFIDGRHDT